MTPNLIGNAKMLIVIQRLSYPPSEPRGCRWSYKIILRLSCISTGFQVLHASKKLVETLFWGRFQPLLSFNQLLGARSTRKLVEICNISHSINNGILALAYLLLTLSTSMDGCLFLKTGNILPIYL